LLIFDGDTCLADYILRKAIELVKKNESQVAGPVICGGAVINASF
jgi:hypothetical protein